MDTENIMQGGCLCETVRYSVTGLPFAADHCHCRMCQKSTGAVVASWMDFKKNQLSWLAEVPTEFASSQYARRGFCSQCGSTLSFRDTRYPDYVTLAIASLDNPNLVKPTYHIYTDSQVEWLGINDDCKRYAKGQPKSD